MRRRGRHDYSFGGDLFKSLDDIDIVRVNCKSVSTALSHLRCGQLQCKCCTDFMAKVVKGRLAVESAHFVSTGIRYLGLSSIGRSMLLFCLKLVLWTTVWVSAAVAQNYPAKPVRILTGTIGGNLDLAARIMAPGLTTRLGQQVIVENHSGVISMETVAKALPDGYTILVFGTPLWIGPILQKLSYDVQRDFAPITLAASTPNILVVHPSVPAKSVKELIALAKARPGQLNYATGSVGAVSHLAAELFKYMAKVDMVRVAYAGTGPADIALLGGQVQLMFSVQPAVAPHIKSGRLRALAVTSAQPSVLLPVLPTVAATGLPGYESVLIYGALAPAKTASAIIKLLNEEMVRNLKQEDVKEKFFSSGAEVVGSSPDEFAAAIKSDTAKFTEIIKSAGIRVD
jgi:tripartite-type tricarboxylate transporter receptor subunit TctC